jgi:hypothetical protein
MRCIDPFTIINRDDHKYPKCLLIIKDLVAHKNMPCYEYYLGYNYQKKVSIAGFVFVMMELKSTG